MIEMPGWGPGAVPSLRCVERLGSFPGTSFELPILTLLLLGCSNIPNPGHLSLFWLFFKALGLIPASEGPSTPLPVPLCQLRCQHLGFPALQGPAQGCWEGLEPGGLEAAGMCW